MLKTLDNPKIDNSQNQFSVIDDDVEVRPEVTTLATNTANSSHLSSSWFDRFSSWKLAVRAVAYLVRIVRCVKNAKYKGRKFGIFVQYN